jgi:hypothetical protein
MVATIVFITIIASAIKLGIVSPIVVVNCSSPSGSPYNSGTCGGICDLSIQIAKMITILIKNESTRSLKNGISVEALVRIFVFLGKNDGCFLNGTIQF